MSAKEINVGRGCVSAPCASRLVGNSAGTLYCPCEYAVGLWDSLMAAGSPHGLVPGGYRAIESLRLEKGYRVWGSDVTTTDSPFEAGLGFAVKIKKGEFIGRDALDRAGEPTRRLACLVLDEAKSVVLGSEPVRFEGRALGARDERRVRLQRRVRRSPTPTCPPELVAAGHGVKRRYVGRDVGAEVRAEPLFDPATRRFGPRRRRPHINAGADRSRSSRCRRGELIRWRVHLVRARRR